MNNDIEVLRRLQRWIKAVGTEEADSYKPPSERAADAAIDNVLRQNQHLRETNGRLREDLDFVKAENRRLWTAVEQAREERDHEAEK